MPDLLTLKMQAAAENANAVAVAAVNAVAIAARQAVAVATVNAVAVEVVNVAVLAAMSAAAVVTVSAIAVVVATVPLHQFATTTTNRATGVAAVLHHPFHLISHSVVAPTLSMSEP
jgi:hypothetical protein